MSACETNSHQNDKCDEDIDEEVFDKVTESLNINPKLLPWKFEHVDFELKVKVRNKLKLDSLKLCEFRDSGFEMYRMLSIEYGKYNMDSEGS